MSVPVQKAPFFIADFEIQYAWYVRQAGEQVADRYLSTLNKTLLLLGSHPGLGRQCRFRHPKLKGIRSFRVKRPFDLHLIFYRFDGENLYAERVIHAMRDLPRRLLEPPDIDEG